MKKTEFINCPICSSLNFSKLLISRTERIPALKTYISICKDCGHIMSNPWPTKSEYKKINAVWYKFKFDNEPINLNSETKFVRWNEMWHRVSNYIVKKPSNILDIGSGNGSAIEYFRKKIPDINAHVIEQYKDNWEYLRKLGCEIYNIDIENIGWSRIIKKKFDFIIFRHTLEHVKSINSILIEISNLLSKTGMAYIVVPDSMGIKQKNIKTGFFRPVHLHYFNIENFKFICLKNKLNPIIVSRDEENKKNSEIYGLFKKSYSSYNKKFKNNYGTQLNYILEKIKKNFWTDFLIILKIEIKLIINWKNSRSKM